MKFKEFVKNRKLSEGDTPAENQLGKEIAKELGIIFDAWWKDGKMWQFTDKKYGSTFYSKELNIKEVRRKLKEMQDKFKKAEKKS